MLLTVLRRYKLFFPNVTWNGPRFNNVSFIGFITSVGEETVDFSATTYLLFSLSLGTGEKLRYLIVELPGPSI